MYVHVRVLPIICEHQNNRLINNHCTYISYVHIMDRYKKNVKLDSVLALIYSFIVFNLHWLYAQQVENQLHQTKQLLLL